MTDERAFLRHSIATVAYRTGKVVRDAPPEFTNFKADETSRTPLQILDHMGDLYEWALHLARDERVWNEVKAVNWQEGVDRFFAAVAAFDAFLASDEPLGGDSSRIFQGPIADSLTHTGQLAMLRRMSGSPTKGENYHKADIVVGRVGLEQTPPRREFA